MTRSSLNSTVSEAMSAVQAFVGDFQGNADALFECSTSFPDPLFVEFVLRAL